MDQVILRGVSNLQQQRDARLQGEIMDIGNGCWTIWDLGLLRISFVKQAPYIIFTLYYSELGVGWIGHGAKHFYHSHIPTMLDLSSNN